MQNRMEDFARAKAEVDIKLKMNTDRVTRLQDEVERLRRQVHTLWQDSADKDIKMVQMTKQLSQDKEDILGLNITLESKQELELVSFVPCLCLPKFIYALNPDQTQIECPWHGWEYARTTVQGHPSKRFKCLHGHAY